MSTEPKNADEQQDRNAQVNPDIDASVYIASNPVRFAAALDAYLRGEEEHAQERERACLAAQVETNPAPQDDDNTTHARTGNLDEAPPVVNDCRKAQGGIGQQ